MFHLCVLQRKDAELAQSAENLQEANDAVKDEKEFLEWKKRDPIENILKKINKKKSLAIKEKINKEINEAFNFAEKSPFPDYSDLKLDFRSK